MFWLLSFLAATPSLLHLLPVLLLLILALLALPARAVIDQLVELLLAVQQLRSERLGQLDRPLVGA